jgi:putative ABC transport system permease protein
LITSDLNFLRILPQRQKGLIDIGVVRLAPGTNAEAVRDAMVRYLPRDVTILTKEEYIQREQRYWAVSTPIGYVFTFGVCMGFVVGAIIVYQILFSDVSEHLAEYATLKAMGYSNRYLFSVVLEESVILAALGYLPGFLICLGLYRLAADATRLPMQMTGDIAVFVLFLGVVMCGLSGAIALRKIRSADPAEVF